MEDVCYFKELEARSCEDGVSSDKANHVFMFNQHNSQLLLEIIEMYRIKHGLKETSIFARKIKRSGGRKCKNMDVNIRWTILPLKLKKIINLFCDDVATN